MNQPLWGGQAWSWYFGEQPDGSKEDIALELSNCEVGGEDDRPGEPGEAGDAGSDPLNDPDTLSTSKRDWSGNEVSVVTCTSATGLPWDWSSTLRSDSQK